MTTDISNYKLVKSQIFSIVYLITMIPQVDLFSFIFLEEIDGPKKLKLTDL